MNTICKIHHIVAVIKNKNSSKCINVIIFRNILVISSPECVTEHTMQLLKSADNGLIWIISDNELSKVEMSGYYFRNLKE